MAGDFRQFAPQDRRIGSPETKSNARNAGITVPISFSLGSLAESLNGWLGREDSNLRMVESKSAANTKTTCARSYERKRSSNHNKGTDAEFGRPTRGFERPVLQELE